MSFTFDEAYYLKSKLAQLKATDAATYGNWNTDQVKQAILEAGFASVQDHYDQYSLIEGTSGSPYFNTTEYLEAKAKQLNSLGERGKTDWTVEDVKKAFLDAGFTNAEDHYNQYGCKEMDASGKLINPSNAFDANAYVEAKLAQLQAENPEEWNGKNAQDVLDAITEAGMTPIEHFEEFGKAEGEAAGIDMVQTVPVVERVANDPARDAMNENVPSNYNAATPAPKNVTEGTSVAKPCDMGDESTSKPADPVATPADVDYIPVPGNGIEDSTDKPVELVTAETKDANGNTVTASQYGVTETAEDGSTTTKAVGTDGKVAEDAATIKTVSADGNTTTTDVKQGSTEIKQETVKDGATTTTTTEASLNGGANTVEQTATTEKGTTTTETTVKNADGKVVSESTSTQKGAVTDTTSTTYDPATGAVVEKSETKTTESTAADGTKTTTTTGTITDAEGNETTIDKTETVSTAADGTQTTKVSETVKDADGNVVSATETTTEAARAADGTVTSETTGTTTDADGNVTTVNETTTTKTNPTTGETVATKTVDNTTVDKDGNDAGSEKGTVKTTTDADGNATKTTDMTTVDADGNTTKTETTAEFDAEKGTTTTTGTETTTTAAGEETTKDVDTTTTGDTAGNSNTPSEQAAADAAGGNSEGSDTPAPTPTPSSGGGSTVAAESTVDNAAVLAKTAVSGEETFKGTDTADTFTITATGTKDAANATVTKLTVNGQAGDDVFKLNADVTASYDMTTLNGGAGADTFELGVAPTTGAKLTLEGGAGTDTVKVTLTGTQVDLSSIVMNDVEKLNLDKTNTGTQVKLNTAQYPDLVGKIEACYGDEVEFSNAANGLVLDALSYNVKLASGDNAVTIKQLNGATVTGNSGADTFTLGDGFLLKTADEEGKAVTPTINGGSGTDTVTVTASLDLSDLTLTNVESLTLDKDVAVTVKADTLSGITTVSGSAEGGSIVAYSDALSGATLGNYTNITHQLSSAGKNTVTANAAGSAINAGKGGDAITLGAGVDKVILGDGADTVVLTADAGTDSITNFAVAKDALDLSTAITTIESFGGTLATDAALEANKAYVCTSTTASLTGPATGTAFVALLTDASSHTYTLKTVTTSGETVLGTLVADGDLAGKNFGLAEVAVAGLATVDGTKVTLDMSKSADAGVTVTLTPTGTKYASVKQQNNVQEQVTSQPTGAVTELDLGATAPTANNQVTVKASGGFSDGSSNAVSIKNANEFVEVQLTSGSADKVDVVDATAKITGTMDAGDVLSGSFVLGTAPQALTVTSGKMTATDASTYSFEGGTYAGALDGQLAAGTKIAVTGEDAVDLKEVTLATGINTLLLNETSKDNKVTLTGAQFAQFSTLTAGDDKDVVTISDNAITYTAKTTPDTGHAKVVSFNGTIKATSGTVKIASTEAVDLHTGVTLDGFTTLDMQAGDGAAASNTVAVTADQLKAFTTVKADAYSAAIAEPVKAEVKDTIQVYKGASDTKVDLTNVKDAYVDLVADSTNWTGENADHTAQVTFGTNAQHVVMATAMYNFAAGTAATYLVGAKAGDVVELSAAVTADAAVKASTATVQLSDAEQNAVTLTAVGDAGVTVKAGSKGDTFTSSAKDDSITLGEGIDTVKFAQENGKDTVNGFTGGLAAAKGDKIDLSAFLTSAKVINGADLESATAVSNANTALALTNVKADHTAIDADECVFLATAADAAAVKGLFGGETGQFSLTTGKVAVVLATTADGTTGKELSDMTSVEVYYVTGNDTAANITAAQVATVNLVGTNTLDSLLAANLGVAEA